MGLVARGAADKVRTWHTPAGSRTMTPAPDLTPASPAIRIATPSEPDVTAPGFSATLGAAFRQDNTIGSTLAYDGPNEADKAAREPGFDAWKSIAGTKYEDHWQRFYDVFNTSAADQMKLQIDKEEEDRSTLSAAGPFGWLASLGAGLVDLPTLLPGGEIVSGIRGGAAVGRSALRVGLMSGVAAAGSEAVLQATQEIRPGSESAFGIGGAMILGGLIGAGASAALGRSQSRAIARGLDRLVNSKEADAPSPVAAEAHTIFGGSSAGAAAVDVPSLSDLTVKGVMAKAVTEASAAVRLNPIVRILTSPSRLARFVGVNMFDNPIYLRMHGEGRTPGQSTETLVQQFTQGAVARSMQESRAAFDAMRKRGVQMGYDEFRRAVGKAGRRGDEGPEPEISAAARAWRKHVGDPLKDQAIATKNLSGNSLLPADVAPKTALSYFSRLWNRHKIEANEQQFRGVVRDWVGGQVEERVTKLTATRDKLVSRLQQRISDAEMPPEARAAHVDALTETLKKLQTDRPDFVALDSHLSDLRSKVNAASDAGREADAATMRGQVRDTVASAGKDYADYRSARALAASRLRAIRNNVVGKADQVEQLRQAITDAEFANVGRLERLHRSLTLLDEKIEAEGPDSVSEELSKARTEFAGLLEKSDKMRERLVTAREATAKAASTVGGETAAPPAELPADFYQILDQARARSPGDPEKRMKQRPLLGLFKAKGGVDPGSVLAGELRNVGATRKNSPGLFKEGGIGAADNWVKSERDFLADLPDDGQGYVDQDALVAAFSDEIMGAPLRSPQQAETIDQFRKTWTAIEQAREELENLGVDFDKMSNEEVLQHLSDVQNDREEMRRLAAIPPPKGEGDYGAGDRLAAAAVRVGDKVYTGENHAAAVAVAERSGETEDAITAAIEEGGDGFTTDGGRFVERAEARKISDAAGQTVANPLGSTDSLAAEDVKFGPAADVLTKRQAELKAAQDMREKLFASAELKRFDGMNKAANEIGNLESVDPEAAVAALRDLVQRRLSDAAGLVERGAFRIKALLEKVEKADPKHVEAEVKGMRQRIADIERAHEDKVSVKIGDPGADRESYVNDIVDSVFNQITGRVDAGASRDIVPIARGPLKERTFNIPDNLVEDYLEHDAELVWRRYARTMSAEIELTKKFGSADMKDAFTRIAQEYQELRAAAKDDKAQARLHKREKRDVRDLAAVRDMLRGTYMAKENSTGFARMLGAVNALNYLRSMGGVVLSSATDVARPMMVHGLGRWMAQGVLPMVSNLRAIRLSAEDAKWAGVAELELNTRMATWAELTDPYTHRTPFENFLENTSRGFSKANGMVYWNDFQKRFTARITQHRILEGARNYAASADKAYLAYLGIDASAAEQIAAQFAEHGETHSLVKVANTTEWTDPVATRIYRAAVIQDVNSTIVTKGVGDTPLLSHTPIGRMVLQFKGFALAAHQRAMIRGLQEAPAGVIAGMITSTAIGMMIYYLKGIEANKPLSDNPGHWMAEGLDKSGLFPVLFEINNTMEKATNLGAYRAFQAAFPGASQGGKASRYVTRSVAASFAGPTGDFVDTIARVVVGLQRTNSRGQYTGLNEGDVNAIARLLPFANLPVIRSVMQYGVLPPVREWAMENNPK